MSACIGVYQEVSYFDDSSVEEYVRNFFAHNATARESQGNEMQSNWTLDEKVLFLASLETEQNRYMHQVSLPLISDNDLDKIHKRLASLLPRNAAVQFPCQVDFAYKNLPISVYGFADAIHNNTIYELKFVSELNHTHFLQCAMYMAASGIKRGILWNVRNNKRYEIRIPNVRKFLDKAIYAAMRGRVHIYENPAPTIPAPSTPAKGFATGSNSDGSASTSRAPKKAVKNATKDAMKNITEKPPKKADKKTTKKAPDKNRLPRKFQLKTP